MAVAEITRRFPRLAILDLVLVAAFCAGAVLWNATWLYILAALALGEAALLYMGRGVLGLLDGGEAERVELQQRYSWGRPE